MSVVGMSVVGMTALGHPLVECRGGPVWPPV